MINAGLRDQIAVLQDGKALVNGLTLGQIRNIMGKEPPQDDMEFLDFYLTLEAKMQYRKADAILKVLYSAESAEQTMAKIIATKNGS